MKNTLKLNYLMFFLLTLFYVSGCTTTKSYYHAQSEIQSSNVSKSFSVGDGSVEAKGVDIVSDIEVVGALTGLAKVTDYEINLRKTIIQNFFSRKEGVKPEASLLESRTMMFFTHPRFSFSRYATRTPGSLVRSSNESFTELSYVYDSGVYDLSGFPQFKEFKFPEFWISFECERKSIDYYGPQTREELLGNCSESDFWVFKRMRYNDKTFFWTNRGFIHNLNELKKKYPKDYESLNIFRKGKWKIYLPNAEAAEDFAALLIKHYILSGDEELPEFLYSKNRDRKRKSVAPELINAKFDVEEVSILSYEESGFLKVKIIADRESPIRFKIGASHPKIDEEFDYLIRDFAGEKKSTLRITTDLGDVSLPIKYFDYSPVFTEIDRINNLEYGFVRLTANMNEVDVLVDGVRVGSISDGKPYVGKITEGLHRIQVKKDFFGSKTIRVKIEANDAFAYDFDLLPSGNLKETLGKGEIVQSTGELVVVTTRNDLKVLIDGEERVPPFKLESISSGVHVMSVFGPSIKEEVRVTVPENSRTVVNLDEEI